jgi:hypothetical protein
MPPTGSFRPCRSPRASTSSASPAPTPTVNPNHGAWDSPTNAAYAAAWTNGSNGGALLQPWAINGGGASMAATNTDASLSLGPRAWALQASGGAVAEAIRPFAGSLHPGDVVSFVFENGWVDTQNPSSIGVAFQNRFGQNLLQFVFQGGTQTYEILDHNPRDSEINWSDSPHVCTLELLTPLTYRLTVNGVVFEGELAESSEVLISRIRFWNYNAGPEPQAKYFIGALSIAGDPLPVFTSSSEIAVTRAASPLRQTSSFESTGDGLVATLSNVSGIDGNVWIADAILDGDWNWTLLPPADYYIQNNTVVISPPPPGRLHVFSIGAPGGLP